MREPDRTAANPAGTRSADSSESTVARFWRTLEERDQPEVARAAAKDEFSPETLDDSLPATVLSRRGFLGLVGGATAAMAATACTTRERTIVPYTKRPPEVIPGVANYYASTFTEGRRSYSVLVKTREGRPIHISGNDEDPSTKGKTSLRAIADILSLYDPDRLRAPLLDGRPSNWTEFEKAFSKVILAAKQDSRGVLLVTGATNSPTRKALIAELRAQLPTLSHLAWEPAIGEAAQSASLQVFGTATESRPKLGEAKVILSLGADFLNGDDPSAAAEFAAKRRPTEATSEMNRLWVLEGPLTLTGANADQRYPVKPSQLSSIAFAIAKELNARHGIPLPPGVVLSGIDEAIAQKQGIAGEAWQKLIADLAEAKSLAGVLAGSCESAETQVAAHLINAMLGSRIVETQAADALATRRDWQSALEAMNAGRVTAVIFWGTNPLYNYPDAVELRAALTKVEQRIWIGLNRDETAADCQWNVPENHWLESWGDAGSYDLLTLQQPVVAPLYDTREGGQHLLFALRILGATSVADYETYLRERWRRDYYPSNSPIPFEQFWHSTLHDGLLRRDSAAGSGGSAPKQVVTADFSRIADSIKRSAENQVKSDFELVLQPSAILYDGRCANNGWLQELPDPITKNTWGNPLVVSVEDAKRLGIVAGSNVEVEVGTERLTVPALVQPGQAVGVLSLALGHGRRTGSVATGVGVNAFPLLGRDSSTPNLRTEVKLKKLGSKVRMALTQSHHRMEGRELVQSLTLPQFAAQLSKPKKKIELNTLYPDQQFPENKWGMVIDLAACVGCSACVIACQSENNIATVGPEQVERGREMHWIRIDTYYEGTDSNPRVVHQPMLCQHCDAAPCENVCPVNATNHSPDGLNQMAYNRCVGTRYCANNCAYKVRRYNFFDYTSDKVEPASLSYNPEVTVRPRGVMEKCTFCVQRIQDARMRAKTEKRPVKDGEIVTACAAACPTGAIVFGDLKNPNSRVAQLSGVRRGYKVLEELGTRPAVTYLAHVRNPGLDGGSDE